MHSSGIEVFSQSLFSVASTLRGIELAPSFSLGVELAPYRSLGWDASSQSNLI